MHICEDLCLWREAFAREIDAIRERPAPGGVHKHHPQLEELRKGRKGLQQKAWTWWLRVGSVVIIVAVLCTICVLAAIGAGNARRNGKGICRPP